MVGLRLLKKYYYYYLNSIIFLNHIVVIFCICHIPDISQPLHMFFMQVIQGDV